MADDQRRHGQQRRPFWHYNAVFDPGGGGSDFSYTVGLASRGLPELHVWARPTLGEDPGLDWRLSPRDTGSVLNRAAWRLVDGALVAGDTWVEEFDAGYVRVRYEVGDPVASRDVDAFEAGASPVLPLRWELLRDPIGPLVPMTAEAEQQASRQHDLLRPSVRRRAAPSAWGRIPQAARWAPDQHFGPRDPLVRLRAAQVWQSTPDQLIRQAESVLTWHDRRPPGSAIAVARAVARSAGRSEVVDRAEAAALELVGDLGTTWGRSELVALRTWFDQVSTSQSSTLRASGDVCEECEAHREPDEEASWHGLLSLLAEQVTALLVTEAVADLLPVRVLVAGQGPTLCALAPDGRVLDQRWACSREVSLAILHLTDQVQIEVLLMAARGWHDVQHTEAAGWLDALRITTAATGPRFELDITGDLSPGMQRQADVAQTLLQRWVDALAVVLTERAALDDDVVRAFLDTGWDVPGLRTLVESPLLRASA